MASLTTACSAVSALSEKEAVVFMQRLAHLENNGVITGPIRQRWQSTFLDLLYTMCTTVQAPFVSVGLVLPQGKQAQPLQASQKYSSGCTTLATVDS